MSWNFDTINQAWLTGNSETGAGIYYYNNGYFYNIVVNNDLLVLGSGPYDTFEEAKNHAEKILRNLTSES